ncbi:E3 ubiquitin-protein ligase ORTHRUS 2-like [Iris pallida]|uniref:RING-type E3 ubiquitin transferase n=1 Tax=Iris pallida TaxID=29817 RepID=A0AAX6HKM1_IRIPA|nr:E3 ubiquitin-protein ligase ORTHRUS 2-like [Iris pallida]
MASDLPIDGDGVCMACKRKPPPLESVMCRTCAAPWHVACLSSPPATLAAVADWLCPDCGDAGRVSSAVAPAPVGSDLVAAIRAIEADRSLTDADKARRRQELMSGGGRAAAAEEEEEEEVIRKEEKNDVLDMLDEKFKCSFCMQLPERPVTTPCGHNFCLKCFQKWIGQGKRSCVKCRAPIPPKLASQPRINAALVVAIRMARTAKPSSTSNSTTPYHFIGNENRPETAFTTERAKYAGKANACSGQIFVTIAPDHFGPILAEHDPKRNKGVLVGESWEDRMECRQWGAHFPHVAGIAGQSTYGAQSVALSGGYADDEDHGEWFLYTGSGGRDLSGNKRTNKDQSFDQKFEKMNESLRVSCKKGYPVRVVRSHKEKRSSYAPETGVRYDGVYRIEMCWRKVGVQGFKVCRYLFVRCDNEPAPWTSDEQGDRPRPLPAINELKKATDITKRKQSPAWDYDEGHGWKWTKPPPESRKALVSGNPEEKKSGRRKLAPSTIKEKLLREFSCLICRKVMTLPLTTPCAHNFCKLCLIEAYDDQTFIRERMRGGRTLRAQKVVKKCPSCPSDISDFVQNPQVNRELMDLIESLQKKIKEENDEESSEQESDLVEKSCEDEIVGSEGKNLVHDPSGSADDKLSEEEAGDNDEKLESLESVDGDSEIKNSEVEEGGEQDCKSPVKNTKTKVSCRRKQTSERKRTGKKAKKSQEVGDILEDTEEGQKMEEVGRSTVAIQVSDQHKKTPVNGSSQLSPSSLGRRVTRQSTRQSLC